MRPCAARLVGALEAMLGTENQMEVEFPSCGLCGTDDHTEVLTVTDLRHGNPGEFKLVECNECSLRYLSPRPNKASIAAFYPKDYAAYAPKPRTSLRIGRALDSLFESYQRHFQEDSFPTYYFSKHIQNYRGPTGSPRILDVGCGSGQKLAYVQKAGWETYGVDFDEQAVENARASGAQAELAEGDAIPFEDDYFNALMSWHSLEHHYDPAGTVREMYRVLRPGGDAIVSVPSGKNVGLDLFGANWGPLEAPRHLYHFTEKTLSRMFSEAGFEVTRFFYDFTFYGLFLGQEIFESLENIAASHNLPLRIPRVRTLSSFLFRIPVLPINDFLGKLWQGGNLIIHLHKPE
jgi:SAM-dependent methyltransferase